MSLCLSPTVSTFYNPFKSSNSSVSHIVSIQAEKLKPLQLFETKSTKQRNWSSKCQKGQGVKRKGVYSDSISRVAAVSTGSAVQIPLSQTSRRLGGHRAIEQNLGAPIGLKCWPSPSTTRAIPVSCCAEATAEIIMTSSL